MLDDLKLIEEIDKSGMLDLLYQVPDMYYKIITRTKNSIRGLRFHNIVNVVILAQGISAIDAKLVKTMLQNNTVIPIIIINNYKLPAFVDDKTLVIVLSLTGNEKEVIFAYKEARNRKAKVLAITAGGKLKKLASLVEAPVITLPIQSSDLFLKVDIGYFFFPLLVVFIEQGIVRKKSVYDIEGSIEFLSGMIDNLTPKVSETENIAKILAKNLYYKIPIICATSNVTEVLAVRWKFSIGKNIGIPVFFDVLPNSDDSKVTMPVELINKFHVIILRFKDKITCIDNEISVNVKVIENFSSEITEVRSVGETFLEQILYLLILGDYTSAYLSILYKISKYKR